MANHYVLHGNGIQIDYTIGGNPGFTALSFTEGGVTTNFTSTQVTTDATGLGTLVSVAVVQSVDTAVPGSASFCPRFRSRSARWYRWQPSAYSKCSVVRTAFRTAPTGSACTCTARRRR